MSYTGDVISDINDFLRNRYDMGLIQKYRMYRNPVLERVRKVSDKESMFAFATGKGHTLTMQTGAPMNAGGRAETGDFPYPGKTTFKQLTVKEIQYAASAGITKEEQEEARASEAAVANLIDIKLSDLRNDIKYRLHAGVRGDGTGRLARVASYSTVSGKVVTVDNTAQDFGWDGTEMMLVGMPIDILTPADTTTHWQTRVRNAIVTALTATTITIDTAGPNSSDVDSANITDGDMVFLAGSTNVADDTAIDWNTGFQEVRGLFGLIDDGTSSFTALKAGTKTGSGLGANYFGVTRTSYPSLVSSVTSFWDGTAAGSWDLEDLLKPIRDIDNGFADGKVTALYCSPDMSAAIARKAALANNETHLNTNGKVTGGYYTRELNVEGRMVPIIPMAQGWPKHTIIGVDEEQLVFYIPQDINFINPYSGKTGKGEVFFMAPGKRNLTFEAWMRFVGQLFMRRCDTSFRLEGLRVDE